MKSNLPVTNKENNFADTMRIVSTTDLKGAISYANKDFIDISGFSSDELIGKNHNIVRHPEMPPAAFNDLWTTIKSGKPWMGIVKNRCNNGDYYWVDAFVTPTIEAGEVTGYQSVRLKPEPRLVKNAEKFYKGLWKPRSGLQNMLARLSPKLTGKIFLGGFGTVLAGMLTQLAMGSQLGSSLLSSVLVMLVVAALVAYIIALPWKKVAEESRHVFENAVAQQVYTGRTDELGQIELVLRMQRAQQETVIWRISDACGQLTDASARTESASLQTNEDMQRQSAEVEQVATAMNEMTATVHEVAKNAALSADATQNTDNEVKNGKRVVDETISGINRLASEVGRAEQVIKKLAADSNQIGGVVDVIRGIAEQTNLLALNAAIEAARAGEQGRGFAVVADEVRTLASRTQSSTGEIQQMIQALQKSAEEASHVMEQSIESATHSVNKAGEAGESLDSITRAVSIINDMSTQIATAAEEQGAVSEEINRNIVNINMAAEQTLRASCESTDASSSLAAAILRLNSMVKQFGLGQPAA